MPDTKNLPLCILETFAKKAKSKKLADETSTTAPRPPSPHLNSVFGSSEILSCLILDFGGDGQGDSGVAFRIASIRASLNANGRTWEYDVLAEEAKTKYAEAANLYRQGRHEEALGMLRELRSAFPQERNVIHSLVLCSQAAGRQSEALAALDHLSALGDPRAECLRSRLTHAQRFSACQRQQVLKKRTRLQYGLAGLAVALCAAVGIVAWTLNQMKVSHTTESQEVESVAQNESNPTEDASLKRATPPPGGIEQAARGPRTKAEYLGSLPVPTGNPSLWQWDSATSAEVLRILGHRDQLAGHIPGSAIPDSLAYPRDSQGPAPPVGQGFGGVLYLNWTTGLNVLMDLSIDVTFHTVPTPKAAVYLQLYDFPLIVPGSDIKVGQYFGFQYWFENGTELRTQVIWSRWNTRDKANAWVAEGGWIESAGYENDFIGIRYPYSWSKGTYTAHVAMRESDNVGTWYELRIYDHQQAEWTKIGRLRFPRAGDGVPLIEDNGGSWVEVFGGVESSEDIGEFHYSFGGVYTCGRTVRAREVELRYAERTPNCDVAMDADGRRVHVKFGGQTSRVAEPKKYTLGPEP